MSKTILCADDSVTMQTVAEITLRASTYRFVGARSADEAVDKARERKPALVLADAVMPGKSGYDLCQTLKADPSLSDVPVILLCGNSSAYDSARGAAAGADGHLIKPWDTQVLLDKIAEHLDRTAASGVARPGIAGAVIAAAAPVPSAPMTAPPAFNIPPLTPASFGTQPPRPPTPMSTPIHSPVQAPLNVPRTVPPAAPRSATIMGMPTVAQPPAKAPATPLSMAPVAPVAPVGVAPVATIRTDVAVSPAVRTRTPMISGAPMKKSQLIERVLAAQTARLIKEVGLDPGGP
jgi:CheY-like chemotaxis protein